MTHSFNLFFVALLSTASLLTPTVARDMFTSNFVDNNQALLDNKLNTEDLAQWNGGTLTQHRVRKMNFLRAGELEGETLTQNNDDEATRLEYSQIDDEQNEGTENYQQVEQEETEDLATEFDGDLDRTMEQEAEQLLFGRSNENSQEKTTQQKCMSSRNSDVYFFVADPTVGPYGILAAIRTAWKLRYPSHLRDALELADYEVIDRQTVDAWISLPHKNATMPKLNDDYKDFMATKPCSWHEVGAVSSAGVSRGHIFYWTESVLVNRTQGHALGLSPTDFNMYADDANRDEAFVDLISPDDDDIRAIRTILQQTYPEVEIGLILATTVIPLMVLLCRYAVCGLYRRARRQTRKTKECDTEQLVHGFEMKSGISTLEKSPATKSHESEHTAKPWNAL